MIKLIEVTNDNIWDVCRLKVTKEQENFVAPNVVSLAEAYVTEKAGNVAIPMGICDEETLVGFVMLGFDCVDENDPKIAEGNYCIWRFMIDKDQQKKGYGRLALQTILDYIKTFPKGPAEYCFLSYEKENKVAKKLYESFGFRENGEICDGELVSVLKL